MNYVLINHIAAHSGRDAAHLRLPSAWARDLGAAARMAHAANVRLIVATPLTHAAAPIDNIEIVPDAAGFEHVALPLYGSAQSFLRERARLSDQLATTIATADVVQLDLGGHPVPLGLLAEPIAHGQARPCLWMVSGERGPTARITARSKHAAKRLAGRALETRMRRDLARAIARANGVIADNSTAAEAIHKRGWTRPTVIESIDVIETELAVDSTIAARHGALLNQQRPLRLAMTGDLTIDRGTEHVLAAMHRCWRLRVGVTLLLSSKGSEVDAVRRHAAEFGLSDVLTFTDEVRVEDADVMVDASLSNLARRRLEQAVARGVPVIAYAPRREMPGIHSIARGAVDELAEALFQAATDRATLASRMIAGHAWTRERTLDAAHRSRFALARKIAGARTRGAA